LLTGKTLANGFRLADQDAFATARGEAFVATADNPSAVYYNPAGIAQLEGLAVRGGLYGICYDTIFTSTGPQNPGREFHSSADCAIVPQFFATYTPEEEPITFGLGVYAPFGGSMNWPEDTGFRSVALKSSLTYVTFNPVVALKVLPSLSLAAGVMANYGAIRLEQGLLANPNTFSIYNYFRFKGCGWAASYNGGALWQPLEQLSFGATIRSPASFKMEGKTAFQVPPNATTTQTRNAHAYFKFPLITTFGVSYRPTPKWNLEFDADYTDWSSMGATTIFQDLPATPNGVNQNAAVRLYWRASWMYEAGVTRYFDNGWHVSAGYVFNESSVPDTYYTPLVADMDRHFLSAGTGFKGKRFNFDVAYQFGYGPPHTVTGSLPSTIAGSNTGQRANGTYEFISHAAIVSVGMNF
jgi:long-chain fatty acid transport protein